MVSGVDDNELDFYSEESEKRYIEELSDQFRRDLENIPNLELSSEDEDYLKNLENEAIPPGTRKQTEYYISKFKSFLKERKLCEDLHRIPPRILNDYLRLFYSQLRTNSGDFYSPSTLVCIRASIHRFLTSPEINRTINILQGDDFKRANGVLRSMVAKYLQSNQPKKREYDAITEMDMSKIRDYFKRSDLKMLQEEVIFSLIYFFGLRGRENLRSLTYGALEIKEDDSGAKYAFLNVPMLSKNVKASLNAKENNDLRQARMYEGTDKNTCPVEALRLYKYHFPKETKLNTPLFLKVTKANELSIKSVLGKCTLGDFMKRLSANLRLSKTYTNHCIRVTVVTVMREQSVPNSDIMLITGHKNARSVDRYDRKRRDKDLRELSHKLANDTSASMPSTSKTDDKIYSRPMPNSTECIVNLTETKCLSMKKIVSDSNDGSESKQSNTKKARLHTSWGLLEIDL